MSIQTTMDTYGHPVRSAFEGMGARLEGWVASRVATNRQHRPRQQKRGAGEIAKPRVYQAFFMVGPPGLDRIDGILGDPYLSLGPCVRPGPPAAALLAKRAGRWHSNGPLKKDSPYW